MRSNPMALTMSSVNKSSVPSVVCNGNAPTEGNKPTTWVRPCNESTKAGPSINGGSSLSPALSDSIISSPQSSNSGDIRPISLALNQNRNGNITAIIQNSDPLLPPVKVSSQGLANGGNKPYFKEEIDKGNCSRGDNHRSQGGGYGYRHDHDVHHEWKPNSYRGVNGYRYGQNPRMQFPREQPRAYMPPLISPPLCPVSFIGNCFTSIWSAYQIPMGYHYVPFNVYSGHPQSQYYNRPSFVPYQDIYAAQQSNLSILLNDLCAKLRKQIEYYLCAENLCSDNYLKRHMDVHGWVPLSLIAGFRKVEQLMKEKHSLYNSFGFWDVTQVEAKQSSNIIQFISDSLKPSHSVEVKDDRVRKRYEWEKWIIK